MVGISFDPIDKESWYFGALKRQEAQDILKSEPDIGTFLVRDSATCPGDFVLCVKETKAIRNYIIKKIQNPDVIESTDSSPLLASKRNSIRFKIGEEIFTDVATLLKHYTLTCLENTTLTKPARKLKFLGLFDFQGKDAEDLPFKVGEILTAIKKNEENWWTAKNDKGKIGCVPSPYIQLIKLENSNMTSSNEGKSVVDSSNIFQNMEHHPKEPVSCHRNYQFNSSASRIGIGNNYYHQSPFPADGSTLTPNPTQIPVRKSGDGGNSLLHIPKILKEFLVPSNVQLPAWAIVKNKRIPNAYDQTALALQVGDLIKVTNMHVNGQWEGDLLINGSFKHGFFPFTFVTFLDLTDQRHPEFKEVSLPPTQIQIPTESSINQSTYFHNCTFINSQ